jgi:radical SAM protein with 4Fe4S-binding SPASM domain
MTEENAQGTRADHETQSDTVGLRSNVDFIHTVKFDDVSEILAQEFGDNFRSYRVEYQKTLNYDKNGYIPEFPLTVQFELVNRCNLKCIMCYTDNHLADKATVKLTTIEHVLRECRDHQLPAAVIGMGSEALLFKDIRKIIQSVRAAGVMDVFLGTNATLLTEDLSEFIVDQKVARVEISLDAATPETYLKIRSKNELDRVERNVRKLIEVKRRRGSKLPIVRLCFCVQPENVHERVLFTEKWKDWVDYIDFQQLIDFSAVNPLIAGAYDKIPGFDEIQISKPHCAYPFNSLNIWANGDVTPCCTFYGKALVLGNIKDKTLKHIWDDEKINVIREELLTGNLNPVCKVCLAQRDKENFATTMVP